MFIYHNSAPSFYSSRGFRGLLKVRAHYLRVSRQT
ncbi:MAG: DUF4256 domain-containing protein [Acetobacterium sp.]